MNAKIAVSALLLATLLPAIAAAGTPRKFAILIDTSGSMGDNDRPRYAVMLARIVGDLLEDTDAFTVIGMPQSESCGDGADLSLTARLDPADRTNFKNNLDSFLTYRTGTHFARSIRTARDVLGLSPEEPRMLLIIADSGGLNCERELLPELESLHDSGAIVAAINLDKAQGAFENKRGAFTFTSNVREPEQLVEAVAGIYQKFLGSNKIRKGSVGSDIEVEIDPFVRTAFLVVVAEGKVEDLENSSSLTAGALDLNYRGGASTPGLDNITRDYRIVKLTRPAPGQWSFRARQVSKPAAWVLIQESSIAIRVQASGSFVKGVKSPFEITLYDQDTGAKIDDPQVLATVEAQVVAAGVTHKLRDDGTDGDAKPSDGVFSAPIQIDAAGKTDLKVRVQTGGLDTEVTVPIDVINASWRIVPEFPARTEVDEEVTLTARLEAVGALAPTADRAPARIISTDDGAPLVFVDDGTDGDAKKGDHIYSARWRPGAIGERTLALEAQGGAETAQAAARIDVVGVLELGPAKPITFAPAGSRSIVSAALDLSEAKIKGRYALTLRSDVDLFGASLEVQNEGAWVSLSGRTATIELSSGGQKTWPLRLRVGSCPSACTPQTPWLLEISSAGVAQTLSIPVAITVQADPWIVCWWPAVVATVTGMLVAFIVFGYVLPSRFSGRLGVQISTESDMNEGFFHPIKAQRGTGVRFYRDAICYVCSDYRLDGSAKNAIAKLRANGRLTKISAVDGTTLWRLRTDGEWEKLPPGELSLSAATVCRNDESNLYFELRTGS